MRNLFSDYLLNVVTLSPEWLYHKVSPIIRAMVAVAQPGRAPVCGTGGRGFKSRRSPDRKYTENQILVSLSYMSYQNGRSPIIVTRSTTRSS